MTPRAVIRKILARRPAELAAEARRRFRAATKFEKILGGRALGPYAVSFWLTRRCNFKCAMCWVAAANRHPEAHGATQNELTLDELKNIVKDIRKWRPRVGVTGGEPFLRRDALEFIAYVKAAGLRCGANTNGWFLAEDALYLVEIGLDSIMVSVDGPAEIHDAIRGVPGSFARARRGLESVLAARRASGKEAPYVKVTCTISAANVNHLPATVRQFADLPLDEFTFQHLWFTDVATAEAQNALFKKIFGQDTRYLGDFVTAVPPLDVAALDEAVAEVKSARYPFPVNFYPELTAEGRRAYYADATTPFRRECFSRWLRAEIRPEGTVTPCLGYVAGNVRVEPFSKIWNGERYRQFRSALAARRLFPGCARCCGLYSD